ncbi:hypothetical protein Bhyg_02564, partial [Pseudolycoriella hygida]
MASIEEQARAIVGELLPSKSKDKYKKNYEKFMAWHRENDISENDFSENVMLVYFDELKKTYAPSSIWCIYSMLRTSIECNHNVSINYPKLHTLLKQFSVGHNPKKSNVFEGDHVMRFLNEAPDQDHLALKVILILGIYGATRADELTKMVLADIQVQGDVYLVQIPHTKNYFPRSFTIEQEYATYLRKYLAIRSQVSSSGRLLMAYRNGKCTSQPIGKNKILGAPKSIAEFLCLPNPDSYTGHSFRRTSATLLVKSGDADLLTLKQHGGWRSSAAAEGYLKRSVSNKRKIGRMISKQVKTASETATSSSAFKQDVAVSDNSLETCTYINVQDPLGTCSNINVQPPSSPAIVGRDDVDDVMIRSQVVSITRSVVTYDNKENIDASNVAKR